MSLFRELKRRNVYKVAAAYAVVAWLLVQIATQTFPFFEIPNWAIRLTILLLVIGFPIALVIAWAFELTPEGVKRTESVPGGPSRASSGRVWIYVVAAAGLFSAGLFLLGRFTAPHISAEAGKSIAVLPFENRSEDKANAFFADGIQDEILTRLAKIADLKVISRTSTQRYKSSPENLPEIARQLGVEHVLEGSVQKAGKQVRVTVQLIRGTTDSHVWAETYDRNLTDILAVESEIASTIARALQAKLTPHEEKAVAAKPTENPDAYEEYLRGLAIWNKLTYAQEDNEEMVRHFSRAVQLDPKFALAWSFLCIAHSNQYWAFNSTPGLAEAAQTALDHAQDLAPDAGETFFAAGIYQYKVREDYDAALTAFAKARERSASRVMATEFSAYVKRRQGKWDDAIPLHAESLEIDPRNPIILSEAALTYRALRRFDEAHALMDRARAIEPENPELRAQKAEFALAQGDTATAERLLKDVVIAGADPNVTMTCVQLRLFQRRYAEAIAILERVLAAPEKLASSFAGLTANYRAELAIARALANDPDAKRGLERARDELASIHPQPGGLGWSTTMVLLVSGILHDKATVDRVAAQLQDRIEKDAFTASFHRGTIATARAWLGEKETALQALPELLQLPGEACLTPALLRLNPLFDPLRSEAQFQELARAKP